MENNPLGLRVDGGAREWMVRVGVLGNNSTACIIQNVGTQSLL